MQMHLTKSVVLGGSRSKAACVSSAITATCHSFFGSVLMQQRQHSSRMLMGTFASTR